MDQSYLAESAQLVAIDPTTGDRAILADNDSAHGPRLLSAYAVALPGHSDYALVADYESRAIFAVDLDTGERVIVTR